MLTRKFPNFITRRFLIRLFSLRCMNYHVVSNTSADMFNTSADMTLKISDESKQCSVPFKRSLVLLKDKASATYCKLMLCVKSRLHITTSGGASAETLLLLFIIFYRLNKLVCYIQLTGTQLYHCLDSAATHVSINIYRGRCVLRAEEVEPNSTFYFGSTAVEQQSQPC